MNGQMAASQQVSVRGLVLPTGRRDPKSIRLESRWVVIRQHTQQVGRWTGISEPEDLVMLEKQHRGLRVHTLHQGQALLTSAPWRDLRGDLLTHPTLTPTPCSTPSPHPHPPPHPSALPLPKVNQAKVLCRGALWG